MAVMACSRHGSDGSPGGGNLSQERGWGPPQSKDAVVGTWSSSDSKQDPVHKVQLWKSGKLVYRLERGVNLPVFIHPNYGLESDPNWTRETDQRFLLVEECTNDADSDTRVSCGRLRLARQARFQAGDKTIRIGDLDFTSNADWNSSPTYGRFIQQDHQLVFKPDAQDLNLSYEKTGKYDYTVRIGNLPAASQSIVFDSLIWKPNDGYTVLPASDVQKGIENVPNARMVWFAVYEEKEGVLSPVSPPSQEYLPIFVPDKNDFKLRLSYSCHSDLSDNICEWGGEIPNGTLSLDLPFQLDQRNGDQELSLDGVIFQVDRKADKFGGGVAGLYPLRGVAYGKLGGLTTIDFYNDTLAQGAHLKQAWIQMHDDHRTFQSLVDNVANVIPLPAMDFPILSLHRKFMQTRCDQKKNGDDQITNITMRFDAPFAVQPTFTTVDQKKIELGWQKESNCVELSVKTHKDDILKMALQYRSKFNGKPAITDGSSEMYIDCDPSHQPDIDDCTKP
jgi:hypothetical protein